MKEPFIVGIFFGRLHLYQVDYECVVDLEWWVLVPRVVDVGVVIGVGVVEVP